MWLCQKYIESQLNIGRNEDVVAESLLNFYYENIEESDKQDIVTTI